MKYCDWEFEVHTIIHVLLIRLSARWSTEHCCRCNWYIRIILTCFNRTNVSRSTPLRSTHSGSSYGAASSFYFSRHFSFELIVHHQDMKKSETVIFQQRKGEASLIFDGTIQSSKTLSRLEFPDGKTEILLLLIDAWCMVRETICFCKKHFHTDLFLLAAPKLPYGSSIWCPRQARLTDPMESLQQRFLRRLRRPCYLAEPPAFPSMRFLLDKLNFGT